jgi:hypothetical protein
MLACTGQDGIREERAMNETAQWFATSLQASADGVVWGVAQAPHERLYLVPPGDPHMDGTLGAWPIARHVCHLTYYEKNCVLPSMRQWLGVPLPSLEGYDDDAAWDGSQEIERFLDEFRQVRAEQIALLPQFPAAAWGETRDAVWGPVTLRWVVSKTYQHTFEHGSTIMRIALFWDGFAHWQAQQEAEEAARAEMQPA